MNKKVISLVLASALVFSALAACGGGTPASSAAAGSSSQAAASSAADSSTAESTASTPEASGANASGPADTTNPYDAVVYANYDWFAIKPWGVDAASKYMQEKFNINLDYQKPDADPSAKLNLMISGGTMPDAMIMDRNADYIKVARLGLLQDLDQYMYEGNDFDANILPASKELLKIDGVSYGIPNWARKTATGGNFSWLINQEVWKTAGSPELKTFKNLYDFAVKVRDGGYKTPAGEDIFPLLVGDTPNGMKLINGFYRSMGAPNLIGDYYSQASGKIQFALDDETFVSALKEANKWFNEGLFSQTIVTDSVDQVNEKLSNGRGAMLYYDFSQDSITHFRQILMETTGGKNSYEVLTDPIFPPAEGVTKVYGEENSTVGWNVNVITTSAKDPQRLFDLFTWMLTKEGSINMMYGPEGGLWEGLDENGNPKLKMPESKISSEEKEKAGCWIWAQPAQSDNVDQTKFAVNAALPKEDQDFTVTLQADVFSPKGDVSLDGQKFITDENVGLTETIDPTEDLGIKRKLIEDTCKAEIPKIIFAKDEAEFNSLVDNLKKFATDNGIADILTKYNEKRDANIAVQGFSYYTK